MEPLIQELLKLGVAGLFIAYLIYCCREKDKRYDTLVEKVDAVQERRALERSENIKAMTEAAAALAKIAVSVDRSTDQTEASIKTAVETIAAATRAIVNWTPPDAAERRRR